MVSNSVYDEGNITRRCKKMIFEDIWILILVCSWFQKIGEIYLFDCICIYHVEQFVN
jgi:hypothetical protein